MEKEQDKKHEAEVWIIGSLSLQNEFLLYVIKKEIGAECTIYDRDLNTFSATDSKDNTESEKKILGIRKNTVEMQEEGPKAEVVPFEVSFSESDFSTRITKKEMAGGDILLSEADLVVSAGRGLKGPENWGMIEDLAKALGAAIGCSKPVSDLGWRPHHEHVGQTGVKVGPSLYIAVGISGAIQHLAGVNSSKVLVAINNDPEAPFFSAADYGIIGDAFEVVPKLTEAIKSLKK